jgi:acyl carrier protein
MDAAQRVRRVLDSVAASLGLDTSGAQPSDDVLKDLSFGDLDSMGTVELALALEKEFQITISDSEAASLHTVGNIVDFVSRKTEPAATSVGPHDDAAA